MPELRSSLTRILRAGARGDGGGRKETMVQHPVTVASILALVFSTIAASAADQNVWDHCNQVHDTDASITACTEIVQAPDETTSNRAIAHYIRGGAYQGQGR